MSTKLFDFDSDFGQRYDKLVRASFFGYEQLFSMITARLKIQPEAEARVLVVGCGTGMELITFGEQMPQWELTGVDPSAQMLEIARQKAEQHGLSQRVELIQGYTSDLPEDKLYDVATMILVLHFIPDKAGKLAVLKEIAARLRESGTLVLLSPHGDPTSPEFEGELIAWKNFMVSNGMSQQAADQIIEKALETGQFTSETQTLALLEEAGFSEVKLFYNAFITSGWIAHKK